jgi:hypothetical protein
MEKEIIIKEAFYKMLQFEAELNLITKTINELRHEMREFRDNWLELEINSQDTKENMILSNEPADSSRLDTHNPIEDLINKDYGSQKGRSE